MTIQRVRSLFYIFITATLFSFLGIIGSADAAPQASGITGSFFPNKNPMNLQAANSLSSGYSSKYHGAPPSGKEPLLYLLAPSPSYPSTLFSGRYFYNLKSPSLPQQQQGLKPSNTYLSTRKDVLSMLAATSDNVNAGAAGVSGPKALFYTPPSKMKMVGVESKGESEAKLANEISEFNSHSLIGLVQYTDEQAENAKKFISNVANLPTPVPLVNLTLLSKTNKNISNITLNTPTGQAYISAVLNVAASYSVAIDNLNYLYNERISSPTKDLGTDIRSLPDAMKQQASPMAIDNWIATRRLKGTPSTGATWKSWHDKIESAGPATVDREIAYLLADMLNELHKSRVLNERLLTTLSISQMQNTSSANITNLGKTLCDPAGPLVKIPGVCPNVGLAE